MTPRRGLSRSLALLLLGLVSCRDGGTPTEFQAPAVLGEVSGLVTADGAPVPGVSVGLVGGMMEEALTGPSGEYRFGGLPGGAYVVTLVHVPEDLEFTTDRAAALVTAGSAVVRADFPGLWRRDATLAVSVTAEGEGLEGVAVALDGPESRQATTDVWGAATFEDLLGGGCCVRISGLDSGVLLFDATEQSALAEHDAVVEVVFEGRPRLPLSPIQPAAAVSGPTTVEISWEDTSDKNPLS